MIYKKNYFIPVNLKKIKKVDGVVYNISRNLNTYPPYFQNVVIKYPKKKLQNDEFNYISKLTNRIFNNLYLNLNNILGTKNSKKYWKIIIYPWLTDFVHGTYFKYLQLKKIEKKKMNFFVNDKILNHKKYLNNYHTYVDYDDKFHYMIYLDISKYFNNFNYFNSNLKFFSKKKIENKEKNLLQKFDVLINDFQQIFVKNAPLINDSFLSRKNLIKFSIKNNFLRISDNYEFQEIEYKKSKIDFFKKDKLFKDIKSNNKFENIIFQLIKKTLPSLFLESFLSNSKKILKKNILKNKPKFVLTANSYWSNIVFQINLAELSRYNVPIFILQHGGQFDILKMLPERDFIFDIADKFLTIGNKNIFQKKYRKKIIQIGYPKKIVNLKNISKKYILLSITTRPMFVYRLQSQMAGPQYDEYLNRIFDFLKNLDKQTRSRIIIKHHNSDQDLNFNLKIKKSYPEIRYSSDKNIFNLFSKCSLHIGTWLSTVEFESIMMGIPTLIINFDEYQDFTILGKKFLKKFEKLKIYFNGLPKNNDKKKLLINIIKNNKVKSSKQAMNELKKSFNIKFNNLTL